MPVLDLYSKPLASQYGIREIPDHLRGILDRLDARIIAGGNLDPLVVRIADRTSDIKKVMYGDPPSEGVACVKGVPVKRAGIASP